MASSNPASGAGELSAQAHYDAFWPRVTEEMRALKGPKVKQFELPLARIKKIMKLDEDVKMISAEAPALFSKAAEFFITELTMRAWIHTEDNKRRTLQKNDVAMAASKYDQFDFLIDIVPRDETKPSASAAAAAAATAAPRAPAPAAAPTANPTMPMAVPVAAPAPAQVAMPVQAVTTDQGVMYYAPQQALPAPQAAVPLATPGAMTPQVIQVQPTAANVLQPMAPAPQQSVHIVTNIVGANGEMQQVTIPLNTQHMDAIRNQMTGGNQGQTLVIQAPPIQTAAAAAVQPQDGAVAQQQAAGQDQAEGEQQDAEAPQGGQFISD